LAHHGAVLADDAGLGKTAVAAAFIGLLLSELRVTAPLLVVVPASALGFWEGELAFWAPQRSNTVVYSGSVAARNCIHDHELWLTLGSLDGKGGGAGASKAGSAARVCGEHGFSSSTL